jgi:glycerol-3-phosphate dehydrogenase
MRRDPSALAEREFDLLVVGSGIFGASAAWYAARRGLSVALIERGDFSCATSANSFKMIHGGIRYLQHLDLPRVRQSSHARRTFLRIAPHLVRPLPIIVPTYGHGMKGKEILRMAMAVYDAVTFDRNQRIHDPRRRIPTGRTIPREEVLARFPGLPAERLTGAALFSDGQMYNPPRLVLAFARSASEAGATVANYVQASRFLLRANRVVGAEARDVLTGDSFDVRARMVLNAAGPYAEGLLDQSFGRGLEPPTPWSRDAYFVVGRPLVPGEEALALQATTRDPDALLSRGERHLFLAPWHGSTLVGVWHTVYEGRPDDFTVTEEELSGFLDEVNGSYAGLGLTLDDVTLWNAGLIPFGENQLDSRDLRFGHRSRLVDHARERGIQGVITLIGVRYTTGPSEGAAAVDLVLRKLGRAGPSLSFDATPVQGGDLDDFEALVQSALNERPLNTPPLSIRALVHNHGTAYDRVLSLARESSSLASPIGSSTVLGAEVVHAVRDEMAVTLGDVVLRRTDLGTAGYPGREALEQCLELAAPELGWDDPRCRRELDRVVDAFPPAIRARREPVNR